MNADKKIERLTRTNDRLKKQLADLQQEYDELSEKENEPLEEVIALMAELRDIEKEWAEALDDINKYRQEYKDLIDEMRSALRNLKRGK
ncbi:MAG: hypothetical protein K5655_04210 [Lachnospiraceae bacterium]|nr:hypothetical protein [Lachnospiraceae bacterium]